MKLSRARLNAATTAVFERTAAALITSCGEAQCAELCRAANRDFDEQFAAAQKAGAAVACTPGCNYCCHLRVELFEHEAAALLDELRTLPPVDAAAIERRIVANAERVDALSAAEHRAARLACAFLVGGRCSVHAVRPSACAAYHSLSRERCEHAFHHPADTGTPRNARPASLELQVFGLALIEATQSGCKKAGRDANQRELHVAMRALLRSSAEPGE